MGDVEAEVLASVESMVKYHSLHDWSLTRFSDPGRGQCQVGSLAGAVSSKKVTEERDGALSTVGNRA